MTSTDADANALREAADGFFLAAEHGRSDVIKALADHSAGRLDLARIVDAATGRTPLHVAVLHRKTDALRVLLAAGFPPHVLAVATPTSSSRNGTSRSVNTNSDNSEKRSAYALAVEAKAHDLVFVFHQFAIQQVAMNSVDGVAQLLMGGVPIDMTDGAATGNTLLHWAVTCRALDVARYLLQEHRDSARVLVDLVNAEGATPLHLACRDGQLEFVQLLLQHGADPRCTGIGGFCKAKTPIDLVTSTEIRALVTSHEEAMHAAKLDRESQASSQDTRDTSKESETDAETGEADAGVDSVLAAVRRKHALQLEEKDLLIRQLKTTIESLVVESQEIRKLGEERTVLDYIRKLREEKDIVRRQLEDAEDHIRIQQQQIQELKREIRNMQQQQPRPLPPMPPRSTSSADRLPQNVVAPQAETSQSATTEEDAARPSLPPLRIDTSAPRSQRSRTTPPRSTRSTRSDSGAWSDMWNVLWGNGLEADSVDADGEVIMTV